MAYPVVNAYSSGKVTTPTWGHTFTMPNGTAKDDLLVLFFVANIRNITFISVPANSSNNWASIMTAQDINLTPTIHALWARALGNGEDKLQVTGQYSYDVSINYDTCIAYICYRIAGIGYPQYDKDYPNNVYSSSKGSIANWVIDQAPEDDDSVSAQHLWLIMVGSTENHIAITPPPNFTNLITEVGAGIGTVSMSSCRREATQSALNPGAFVNAPLSDYLGLIMRIKPGSYPYPITEGFGFNLAFKKVYKTP